MGRGDFAETIAAAMRGWGGRDSLVIAIYGPWGSGKTSIKNMTVDALGGISFNQLDDRVAGGRS